MKSDSLFPAVHSYLGFMKTDCVSHHAIWERSFAELFSLVVFA